jgi:hypothetical protein
MTLDGANHPATQAALVGIGLKLQLQQSRPIQQQESDAPIPCVR